MRRNIPEPILGLLHDIGEVAGIGSYLVGGFVRDLLLKRPSLDIDIVVEGDAIRVAQVLCERWNGTLEVHAQFGTAAVTPENTDLPKVDFVTARRETYQGSGTLPIVQSGSITDDLRRRDFSINTLAMRLDQTAFGTIVDETGGLKDLESGVVRVLHNQSFIDDPTRIFRACRYAGRYGFQIAENDETLIREALPVIAQLSGERIRNEIDRVLLEKNAPEIVEQLTALGIWETICAGWQMSSDFASDFRAVQHAIAWASEHLVDEAFDQEFVRWIALFGTQTPIYQIEALSFRLILEHRLQRLVSSAQAENRQVSLQKVTYTVFEKLGYPLSQNAVIEHHNGKWCIVDADVSIDKGKTYISGEGSLFRVETRLTAYKELKEVLALLNRSVKPSEIYRLFKSYPTEALVLASEGTTVAEWKREKIRDYLLVLRKVQPFITGKDLIAFGEKPGQTFKTRLWQLFAAQLDGEIKTKEEAYSRLEKINSNG